MVEHTPRLSLSLLDCQDPDLGALGARRATFGEWSAVDAGAVVEVVGIRALSQDRRHPADILRRMSDTPDFFGLFSDPQPGEPRPPLPLMGLREAIRTSGIPLSYQLRFDWRCVAASRP